MAAITVRAACGGADRSRWPTASWIFKRQLTGCYI